MKGNTMKETQTSQNQEVEQKQVVIKHKGFALNAPVIAISQDKLFGMLYKLPSSEIVTIYTNTDARLRKTSKHDKTVKNPFKIIRKCSKVNGLFNVDYQNCVNNQLNREGKETDFESTPKQWGEKINDSRVCMQHVTDEGYQQYIQFNPRNYLDGFYVDNNGIKVEKETLEPFISDKKHTSRQGTDTEIIWRTYKKESIVAVTMRKVTYIVE